MEKINEEIVITHAEQVVSALEALDFSTSMHVLAMASTAILVDGAGTSIPDDKGVADDLTAFVGLLKGMTEFVLTQMRTTYANEIPSG